MPNLLRFDCFDVDLAAGRLFKHGCRIHLRDQSFQVLVLLLENAGEVVSREDLRRRLWPAEVFVDFENSLNTAVARLREALGDPADHPRFVETLPKRGYRFIASLARQVLDRDRALAEKVRVAVLPFLNLTGDPAQEFFSDGVTDDIITELASIAPASLGVIARTTAMRYKGRARDISTIGRELDVGYVVEGGVRAAADRIVINVQVVRASDQEHVFAKRYEAGPGEAFRVQGQIASAVAAAVCGGAGVAVRPVRPTPAGRATRTPTASLAAYEEYVQGRHALEKLTGPGFSAAKAHFERALELDPEFALACDGLADVYATLGYVGAMRPSEAFSKGVLWALKAVEVDPMLAETHALVAQYHKCLYDWPAAVASISRALELNPASPVVRCRHAINVLMPLGRMDEAVAEMQQALMLDPLSILIQGWAGIMLVLSHQWDRAIGQAERLIELDPAAHLGPFVLGVAYREKGWLDDAITAMQRAVDLSGNVLTWRGWLGLVLAQAGRNAEARGLLAGLHDAVETDYVPATGFAWIHVGLGETDAAFYWMDRAIDERDQFIMPIKSYAFLDPIRGDPRFSALLRKMKLEG